MRGLYSWLGMAIAPLTLVYATSRSWSGQGDPPHVPLTRVLIVAIALLNYTWLWSQAVALTNQITHAILGVSAVTSGVQKMFEVLIAGAALGGLPLIGLLLMGAGGLQLLAHDLREGHADPRRRARVRDRAADDRPRRRPSAATRSRARG